MRSRSSSLHAAALVAVLVVPVLFGAGVVATPTPVITAPRAVVIDPLLQDAALHEKDADVASGMASTTKAMTLHLLARAIADGTIGEHDAVTVSPGVATLWCQCLNDASSTGVGEEAGETFDLTDLATAMMVVSSNRASYALAEHLGTAMGATTDPAGWFINAMNARATALGLTATTYTNPAGYQHEQFAANAQSARDLARLWAHAVEDPWFAAVARSEGFDFTTTGAPDGAKPYTWARFADYPGWEGFKGGFTEGTRFSWVESATRLDRRLVATALNAPEAWQERDSARAFLDAGFGRLFTPRLVASAQAPVGATPWFDVACDGSYILTAEVTDEATVRFRSWLADTAQPALVYGTSAESPTLYYGTTVDPPAPARGPVALLAALIQQLASVLDPVPGFVKRGIRGAAPALPDDVPRDLAVGRFGDGRYITASVMSGYARLDLWGVEEDLAISHFGAAALGAAVAVDVAVTDDVTFVVGTRDAADRLTLASFFVEHTDITARDTFIVGNTRAFALASDRHLESDGHGRLGVTRLSTDGRGHIVGFDVRTAFGDMQLRAATSWAFDATHVAMAAADPAFDEDTMTVGPASFRSAFVAADGTAASLKWTFGADATQAFFLGNSGERATAVAVAPFKDDGAVLVRRLPGGDGALSVWEHRADTPRPAGGGAFRVAADDIVLAPGHHPVACVLAGPDAEGYVAVGHAGGGATLAFDLYEIASRVDVHPAANQRRRGTRGRDRNGGARRGHLSRRPTVAPAAPREVEA